MAEIFRPTYTVTDPKTGQKVKRKSRRWWVRFYADGERKKVKGYTDKKATEALATELQRQAAREAAGTADFLEAYAKQPLAEHAEDFRRYLAAKGDTADYVGKVAYRLQAVLDGCRFIKIIDVQPTGVMGFLADLRASGKGLKTTNEYMAAAKNFTRWLWRNKRVAVDPLVSMSKLPSKGDADVRHARRDLSLDELQWLLDAARLSGKVLRRLPGIDRYFLYLTASCTGFRAAELASMEPEAFDLTADPPTARVKSTCTKNKKLAVQPLPLDVAEALGDYLASKPARQPVWPGKWKTRAFLMVQTDLEAARQVWLAEATGPEDRAERERSDFLAYCNAAGEYADFHSLRHGYITRLVKSGVSPKVAQELARHSTVQLTLGRYAHVGLHDLAGAVEGMPSLLAVDKGAEQVKATGTDDRPTIAFNGPLPRSEGQGRPDRRPVNSDAPGKPVKAAEKLGPKLGPSLAYSGDFLRQIEICDTEPSPTVNPLKQAEKAHSKGFTDTRLSLEPRGIEPLTPNPQPIVPQDVSDKTPADLAYSLARVHTYTEQIDPDLARILAAWPTLPEPIRLAMMALVKAGKP